MKSIIELGGGGGDSDFFFLLASTSFEKGTAFIKPLLSGVVPTLTEFHQLVQTLNELHCNARNP